MTVIVYQELNNYYDKKINMSANICMTVITCNWKCMHMIIIISVHVYIRSYMAMLFTYVAILLPHIFRNKIKHFKPKKQMMHTPYTWNMSAAGDILEIL